MKNKILATLVAFGLVGSVSAIEINDNLSINGFIDTSYTQAKLYDNASAASSSSITIEQRQRYLREVVRLSTRLSDQLHSMRNLQEMLIVPSISQVVSASEQKSFNNTTNKKQATNKLATL